MLFISMRKILAMNIDAVRQALQFISGALAILKDTSGKDRIWVEHSVRGVCLCAQDQLEAALNQVAVTSVRDGFYYGLREGNHGSVWYADHGDGTFVKEHPEPYAEAARLNVEKYKAQNHK